MTRRTGLLTITLEGVTLVKSLFYGPIMLDILKEAESPPFSIQRKAIPAGTLLRHYDPGEGRVFYVKFMGPFPVIVLSEGSTIWMSTVPFEVEGLRNHLSSARGSVLVGGLGLGIFPYLVSKKKNVRSIHIIEKEQKVIDLVWNQFSRLRLGLIGEITCDDIYHYLSTTSNRYDFIYLDIWPSYTGPIEDVDKAVLQSQRCLRDGGVVRVWLQELIDRVKDLLPKDPQYSGGVGIYEPCLLCGKKLRNDYAGLCMDCADSLGVSELYKKRPIKT